MVSLRTCLAAITFAFVMVGASCQGSTNLADWLAAQVNIRSWSADFVQTRTLKALVQPLKSEGHIWFAAPNRFRWELGKPPQTIAARTTNALVLVYPKLKRVELYPLAGSETGSWRDMLALLEAGFPRSKAELESQFRVLSVSERAGKCQVALQPKSAQARRWIGEIGVEFDVQNFALTATELRFADGSILRNDFLNPALNIPLDDALFSPKMDPGFKIVEPLKKPER